MDDKKKETLILIMTLILLIFFITNLLLHLKHFGIQDWKNIFWFCDFVAILFLIGYLTKKKEIFGAILIAAIPAQSLWIIDFIFELLGFGLGRTEHMLEYGIDILIVSSIFHIIIIPFTFYAVYLKGLSKKSIYYSIIIFGALLTISFYFTPSYDNINCVHFPCDLDYEKDYEKISNSNINLTEIYLLKDLTKWFFSLIITYFALRLLFKRLGKLNN